MHEFSYLIGRTFPDPLLISLRTSVQYLSVTGIGLGNPRIYMKIDMVGEALGIELYAL